MKADLLAFEDSNGTDPEVMREIWARRAARLAKVPEQEDEGEHIALVLIRLGQEIYGLEAQYVFDIRPLAQITTCLLYTSPSPRDRTRSRMPSSA